MRCRIIISLFVNGEFASSKIEAGEFIDLEKAKERGREIWKTMPLGTKQIMIFNIDNDKTLYVTDNFSMLRASQIGS